MPTISIRGASRGRIERQARAAAVLCSQLLGLAEQRIATALNMSQQRVSVLRRQIPSGEVRDLASRVMNQMRAVEVGTQIGAK